jgi:enoyl-CoA hydratase/carnithine racemase
MRAYVYGDLRFPKGSRSTMDIFLTAQGRFAEITLSRPLKKNAMTVDMWRRIPELAAQAQTMPEMRGLIVRGAGGMFSAGADIAEFPHLYATQSAAMANQTVIQAAMTAIEEFALPTIAVIEGSCYGGGCGLALACDLRIASQDAKFGVTPAKLGLVYGLDDTRRLVNAVGISSAKNILFTGRTIAADEALRLGLVDAVHHSEKLEAAVRNLTESLLAASSHTAKGLKQILRRLANGQHHDCDETRAMFGDAFSGEDFREGFDAFMQKRAPQFR